MEEWKKAGVCFNTQYDAPLVLAFSIPTPINEDPVHWTTSEFPTSRDATFIALGTNMWNVICTVVQQIYLGEPITPNHSSWNSCVIKFTTQKLEIQKLLTIEEFEDHNK